MSGCKLLCTEPNIEITEDNKEKKRNEKEGIQPQRSIVDLDILVRKIAERIHNKKGRLQWCMGQCCLQKKKTTLELDWSEVKFHPEEPVYTEINAETPGTKNIIVFSTVFENKSQSEQEQTIKIERMTSSTSTCSLTEGYSVGGSLNLNIKAPGEVVSKSCGFTKGITIENAVNNEQHENLTWSTEGKLVVKENSKVTAKLQVKEEHRKYNFECRVAVQGTIKAAFYDTNRKKVGNYKTSMRTIILEEIQGTEDAPDIDDAAYMTIRGKCGFKFGVEQQIIIE